MSKKEAEDKCEDSNFLLSEILGAHAQLYKIMELEEVGSVYFFCTEINRNKVNLWKLSLVIFANGIVNRAELDLKTFLKKTLQQDTPGLRHPDSIDIIIIHSVVTHVEQDLTQVDKKPLNKKVNLIEVLVNDEQLESFMSYKQRRYYDFDCRLEVNPIAVNFIVGLITICFVLQQILKVTYPEYLDFEMIGVNSINLVTGNYIGLVLGTFAHGNIIHFLMNIMALFYLGRHLSRFYSTPTQLLVYFVSAWTGIMGSIAFSQANSIGSSGAIFGVLGALLVASLSMVDNVKNNTFWRLQLKALTKSLLFCLVLSIVIPFFIPRIDIWGHLGGFVGGVLLSIQLSSVKIKYKLVGFIATVLLLHPWSLKLEHQKQWAKNLINQRESIKKSANQLIREMNNSLNEINHYVKVFLDFSSDHVRALHLNKIRQMQNTIAYLRGYDEFKEETRIQQYFDCIENGLNLVVNTRDVDSKANWLKEHSDIEKIVMEYYGISRVDKIQ